MMLTTEKIHLFSLVFLLLFAISSCDNSPEIDEEAIADETGTTAVTEEIPEVEVIEVKRSTFDKELISQGKLKALERAEVTFHTEGRIKEVAVRTGQFVEKGTILATLEDFEARNAIQQIEYKIEQAKRNLDSRLITLGFEPEDSADIPEEIYYTAKLDNNIDGLLVEKELALHKLEQMKIRAPVSGLVADLSAQPGNPTGNYDKLCTIVSRQLKVVFPILESEVSFVKVGQPLDIIPLHNPRDTTTGKVTAINPLVDEHGLIQVHGSVNSRGKDLLAGMSVQVHLNQLIPDQIVIPKEAVVDRQGRLVVFLYKNRKAHWTYVKTGFENSWGYTVNEGLSPGDTAIVSNNFHLSHLQRVMRDED